jgi:LysM repeat protein/predicted esterase
MRRFSSLLSALALAVATAQAAGAPQTHTVADGHTLGKIAKRYNVSIEALCNANGISRRDAIKPGQKLVIPDPDDKDGANARRAAPREQPPALARAVANDAQLVPAPHEDADRAPEPAQKPEADKAEEPESKPISSDGMRALEVSGAGTAYYYEPLGPGRKSMRPVIMYLHGRGGQPRVDCKRWAPVARRLGWLVCPSGPGARGDGRGWNNNWGSAHQAAMATLNALRGRYGRRVQLYGNTIMGFSEGAYAALNVGVREPRTFNRWLIMAGDAKYLGGPGIEALSGAGNRLRRVYLITGEQDGVIDGTRQIERWLKHAGVATRVSTPKDMGHEVALDDKAGMYRAALVWLDRG